MKKPVTIIASLFWILCLSSCYSNVHLTEQSEFEKYSDSKGLWVTKVITNLGDSVMYSKKYPGVLKDSAVISQNIIYKKIPKNQVDSTHLNFNETRTNAFWVDGKRYKIKKDDGLNFVYAKRDTFSILLTNLAEVDARRFMKTASALFTMGTISAATGVVILILLTNMDLSIWGAK